MTKTILIAAAAAVALAGCESMYPRTGGGTPPPDSKNPRVWVVTKTACENPRIVVSPEPIYVYRGNGPVTITWHLQTPGYSFATQAQNPPPAAVDPGRPDEISCPNASGNNMVCIDKAENSGSWKYKIQITADSKGPCAGMNPPILDPNISND